LHVSSKLCTRSEPPSFSGAGSPDLACDFLLFGGGAGVILGTVVLRAIQPSDAGQPESPEFEIAQRRNPDRVGVRQLPAQYA